LACTRIALYADGGVVLAGTVSQYAGTAPEKKVDGYQAKLTIPVPALSAPASPTSTGLTDFWTNINNGGFVRTKCGKSTVDGDQNETIKYRATWTDNVEPTATDSPTGSCTGLDPIA
jgi:hypothetical protein